MNQGPRDDKKKTRVDHGMVTNPFFLLKISRLKATGNKASMDVKTGSQIQRILL
jgi:hypothetical protein